MQRDFSYIRSASSKFSPANRRRKEGCQSSPAFKQNKTATLHSSGKYTMACAQLPTFLSSEGSQGLEKGTRRGGLPGSSDAHSKGMKAVSYDAPVNRGINKGVASLPQAPRSFERKGRVLRANPTELGMWSPDGRDTKNTTSLKFLTAALSFEGTDLVSP